jgi:branched-chain amino acid transport system substrate-binding protein
MTSRRGFAKAAIAAALAAAGFSGGAQAQNAFKIGELNSYKSQPAFLEPYRRG